MHLDKIAITPTLMPLFMVEVGWNQDVIHDLYILTIILLLPKINQNPKFKIAEELQNTKIFHQRLCYYLDWRNVFNRWSKKYGSMCKCCWSCFVMLFWMEMFWKAIFIRKKN